MQRRTFLAVTPAILLATSYASVAAADESAWGNLQGRFVFEGEPPEPKRFEITKDGAHVKEPVFDESLLVDKQERGLANVVVRLVAARSAKLPVHPSHAEARKKPVNAAIEGLAFRPHVIVVQTGQALILKNADPVGHNAVWDAPRNPEIGKAISAGPTLTRVFKHPESEPVCVACGIHPWESALLIITDHPYVAVSQRDGSFSIDNLPVGTWEFQFWHERARWLKRITVGGKRRALADGKLRIEIKPGANDVGEIKIEPELLKWKR